MAVFSHEIKGGKQAGFQLCDSLKMVINTTNRGDFKTLVVHIRTATHQQLTDAERFAAGVTEDHIRLSVGIEHIEDIKDDFRQAFAALDKPAIENQAALLHHKEQKEITRSLYGTLDKVTEKPPTKESETNVVH